MTCTDGIANRVFRAVFAVPGKRSFDVTLAYWWRYAGARVRVVLKLYWRRGNRVFNLGGLNSYGFTGSDSSTFGNFARHSAALASKPLLGSAACQES